MDRERKTNLLAYGIFVLGWSLALYGLVLGASYYTERQPPKEKPGLSEICAIAEENNLTSSQVAAAIRGPRNSATILPSIILSQAFSIGLTLGVFALLRRWVARILGKNVAAQGSHLNI